MKKSVLTVAILSLCIFSPFAHAGIIDSNCVADGDGAIVMNAPGSATYTGEEGGIKAYEMKMTGTQYQAPAHVEGYFTTDLQNDPIVWIVEEVDNSTGFTWTSYEFKVYMNKVFTIPTATAPAGWTFSVGDIFSDQPLPVGTGTGWMGVVTFTSTPGYEIHNGDTGMFSVKTQFSGTVAFCTEQTPIPEPATLAMLGFGALALLRKKK